MRETLEPLANTCGRSRSTGPTVQRDSRFRGVWGFRACSMWEMKSGRILRLDSTMAWKVYLPRMREFPTLQSLMYACARWPHAWQA
jgi:hypothetical protein